MKNHMNLFELEFFLDNAQKLVVAGKYDFVPRRKNMCALAQYGLTIQEAKEEIAGLLAEDYYKGPKKDFECDGTIWEFKKKIKDIPFYIKLKIVEQNGEMILKCLGFHDDEFV